MTGKSREGGTSVLRGGLSQRRNGMARALRGLLFWLEKRAPLQVSEIAGGPTGETLRQSPEKMAADTHCLLEARQDRRQKPRNPRQPTVFKAPPFKKGKANAANICGRVPDIQGIGAAGRKKRACGAGFTASPYQTKPEGLHAFQDCVM